MIYNVDSGKRKDVARRWLNFILTNNGIAVTITIEDMQSKEQDII
jgi:hypothetical protein